MRSLVEEDGADLRARQEVVHVVRQLGELRDLALVLGVDGVELLVDALELFVGALQLLVRRQELLVGRLQLLVAASRAPRSRPAGSPWCGSARPRGGDCSREACRGRSRGRATGRGAARRAPRTRRAGRAPPKRRRPAAIATSGARAVGRRDAHALEQSDEGSSSARCSPPTSTIWSSGVDDVEHVETLAAVAHPEERLAPPKEWTSSPRSLTRRLGGMHFVEERVVGAEELRDRVARRAPGMDANVFAAPPAPAPAGSG